MRFLSVGISGMLRERLVTGGISGTFQVVGFIQYFLDICNVKHEKQLVKELHEKLKGAKMAVGDESLDAAAIVGLADSLVNESFIQFVYGTTFAIAGFVGEVITRFLASIVSYLITMVAVLE